MLVGAPFELPDGSVLADFASLARRNWQIVPLLRSALQHSGQERHRPAAWVEFLNESLAVEAFSAVQVEALGEVCAALGEARIRYALLKSSAVRLTCYGDPVHRTGWDLDVAVAHHDLGAVTEVLEELGYAASQFNPLTRRFGAADPQLRAAVEAEHYELGFMVRRNRVRGLSRGERAAISGRLAESRHWHSDDNGELCCYTTIDVHHGLSLEISASELLLSAKPFIWNTREVWIPSLAWLAFHVIYKVYWEGVHAYGKGLYQYADLCRIVGRMQEKDACELIALLDAAHLRAAGYYVLRRLPTALGTPLPDSLTDYVAACAHPEAQDPVACNDLGDMWDKLWNRR